MKKHFRSAFLLTGMLAALVLNAGPACAANKKVVRIVYSGRQVEVTGKAKGVDVRTTGARVEVENNQTDNDEVEFVLEGKSDNGNFEYKGRCKTTIVLNGVSLRSNEGAALNLKSGKRMKINISEGTENNLEDGLDTLHKACVYTKGHLEISGGGTLNITCHSKNAVYAKEYIAIGKSTGNINITSDIGNAINTGGTLTINGGDINIRLSSVDKKGLKSDSLMTINDGVITLALTGDGGKGIKSGGDLVINNGKLTVITSGNYLSEASGFGGSPPMMGDSIAMEFGPPMMGGFGMDGSGAPPMMGDSTAMNFGPPMMGGFMGEFNDSAMQAMMDEGRKMMERFQQMTDEERDSLMRGGLDFGAPPMGGPGMGGFGSPNNIELSDSVRNLLFADEDSNKEGEFGGPGGRRNLEGTAKAVKAMGRIVINGGDLRLETSTAGAEGLEGKQGVTICGGKIYIKAKDDAINSGGKIVFAGGDVFAWSIGNDAIDSNSRETGAITISGGKVIACSQCGPPDEAFDCDFSPFILTGGTVFGMGGSMGGQTTSPTVQDDTQPTVILSGLPCPKGKTLVCADEAGTELFTFDIPFTMQSSSSILSLPQFELGKTYIVKIKEPDVEIKRFTFDEAVVN